MMRLAAKPASVPRRSRRGRRARRAASALRLAWAGAWAGAWCSAGQAALLAADGPAVADAAGAAAVSPASPVPSTRSPLAESGSEAEHLTGGWGGWRDRLVERGVHVQAGYFGEGLGTLSGGLRREAVYEGLLEGAVNLDLERLLGWWRGASLRVSALVPHGRSPSGRLTGDLQTLSNIDAEDGVALYELWLEQSWAADRVSVRAGQLLADAEFATTDYAAALIHSAFGWPASISANARNTGPAYPRAALGLRTRWEPSAAWQFQAGVFDGDTFDANGAGQLGNDHGTSMHLSGNQGAFVIAEAAWRHHHDTNAPGLPGVLKVGGWWHTATFADVQVDGQTHGANGGLYVASQQLVWRETDGTEQGLGVFLRAGWAPSDRNLFSVAGDGGVHYLGPVPGRDDDVVALGVAMAWMSGDVRDAARADGVSPLPDYELAVELSYQANLRPWLAVQPVFQWIRHPGGSAAIDDALVAGLRFRLTF